MTVAAILTAAGSGSRLGLATPKALVLVAGLPLVAHAVDALLAARSSTDERVEVLVVTAPADALDRFGAAVGARVGAAGRPVRWLVVAGGASRQASVAAGLAALGRPTPGDTVLVHDAARPFAPPELVARVMDAVRSGHAAVVPALPVTDTVKRVGPAADGAEPVLETPDRTVLRAVQTPQGFARGLLDRAHTDGAHRADDETRAASDDAGLVEALGERVWVVPGDERAAKITTARDLALARLLREAP